MRRFQFRLPVLFALTFAVAEVMLFVLWMTPRWSAFLSNLQTVWGAL